VSYPRSTAAFFDLDGTLLPAPSLEWRFATYLMSRGKLGAPNTFRWLSQAVVSLASSRRLALDANKQYLAGLSKSLVPEWLDSLRCKNPTSNSLTVFNEGLKRMRWHQSQNHRVFLVSGTLAPLASTVASLLPPTVEVVATDLATSVDAEPNFETIWTGQLAGDHMTGAAKSRALRFLAARHNLNLASCFAYGDSPADSAMLEIVGHPEVINPSRSLARVARKRGWPVSRWGNDSRIADRSYS